MIILDFGSGNTCKNDPIIIKEMIDSLYKVDKKRQCIIKWQLFKSAGNNIPLNQRLFDFAYYYAAALGFQTTASVFDKESLGFLLSFKIPFIKIANQPKSKEMMAHVPDNVSLVVSYGSPYSFIKETPLFCVSKYPAELRDYEDSFDPQELMKGISDHTINWSLYRKYSPLNYECHYKLENSTGLDAGPFARTPKMLGEILK